ncbi:MAG: hypothetical protein ABJC24_00085 [Chloroflexota bacterium]
MKRWVDPHGAIDQVAERTAQVLKAAEVAPSVAMREDIPHLEELRAAAQPAGAEIARLIAAAEGNRIGAASEELIGRVKALGSAEAAASGLNRKFGQLVAADAQRLAPVAANTARELKELIDRSNLMATQLRGEATALREPTRLPPIPPRPEAQAAWVVQEQLPALVDLQARTFDQIAAMGTIAQAELEESRAMGTIARAELEESQKLRKTLGDFIDQAKRSSDVLKRLTYAIFALTAVLAYLGIADPLNLWPFNSP